MGEIVQLSRYQNGRTMAPIAGADVEGIDAEVVIFPGVRVERQTVDLSMRHQDAAGKVAAAGAKKGGRKRTDAYPKDNK